MAFQIGWRRPRCDSASIWRAAFGGSASDRDADGFTQTRRSVTRVPKELHIRKRNFTQLLFLFNYILLLLPITAYASHALGKGDATTSKLNWLEEEIAKLQSLASFKIISKHGKLMGVYTLSIAAGCYLLHNHVSYQWALRPTTITDHHFDLSSIDPHLNKSNGGLSFDFVAGDGDRAIRYERTTFQRQDRESRYRALEIDKVEGRDKASATLRISENFMDMAEAEQMILQIIQACHQ